MRQKEKKKEDKDPQEKEDAPSFPPSEEEGLGLKPTNRSLTYNVL